MDFTPAKLADLYERAIKHHQSGRLAEAARDYKTILDVSPREFDALHYLGVVEAQRGNSKEAQSIIRRALEINPRSAEANSNLGNVYLELKRPEEAIAHFREALSIQPGNVGALFNLGNSLRNLQRFDEALTSYDAALAIDPRLFPALNNRGELLKNLERYPEALSSLEKALESSPNEPGVFLNIGNIQRAMGRFDKALLSYRQALKIKPDYAEAHNSLGCALMDKGKFDDAASSYRDALAIKSDYPEGHANLGNALLRLGKLDEAIASLRTALALNPNSIDAHRTLGAALQEQGKGKESVASYQKALALKPDDAMAHQYLGTSFFIQNRIYDASASFRKALLLKPDFAEAHSGLGNSLTAQGNFDEAISSFKQAIALKPDNAKIHSNLLFCLNYHPDFRGEDIFKEYRRWNAAHATPFLDSASHVNSRDPQRRIRVGYVSPDLRHHSARHFIEPLLAHHDRSQFEVFAYAEVSKEDTVSARFKSYVDKWQSTVGFSDAEVAAMIRRDGVDILVDLAGHTGGNRLQVFARKPAPLQVSWLGFGYTAGMDAMDYFVADAVFAPAGCEDLFAEKIIHLPVFAVFRPADNMGSANTLPALSAGIITFGTLSRSVRINYRVVRTWAAILQRVVGSRLIVNSGNFQSTNMQAQLRAHFADYGIASERVLIGCDSPPWDVLRKIDISLDCFPHSSGTTLFESLYLGVPYITLAERPSVGRLGASVVAAVGYPEWIAHSETEYVNKATALASDLGRLADIRTRLRTQMERSPLMNEPAFARSIETAFRAIWQQWCKLPREIH